MTHKPLNLDQQRLGHPEILLGDREQAFLVFMTTARAATERQLKWLKDCQERLRRAA